MRSSPKILLTLFATVTLCACIDEPTLADTPAPRQVSRTLVGGPCSPDLWTPPSDTGDGGVQALLKDIPLTTTWAQLPSATKAQLQKLADDRLSAFRKRWARDALAKKETICGNARHRHDLGRWDECHLNTYSTLVSDNDLLLTEGREERRAFTCARAQLPRHNRRPARNYHLPRRHASKPRLGWQVDL